MRDEYNTLSHSPTPYLHPNLRKLQSKISKSKFQLSELTDFRTKAQREWLDEWVRFIPLNPSLTPTHLPSRLVSRIKT
jgi:hypothetical protein